MGKDMRHTIEEDAFEGLQIQLGDCVVHFWRGKGSVEGCARQA